MGTIWGIQTHKRNPVELFAKKKSKPLDRRTYLQNQPKCSGTMWNYLQNPKKNLETIWKHMKTHKESMGIVGSNLNFLKDWKE